MRITKQVGREAGRKKSATQTARALSRDEQEVRATIRKAMENWSALEADANAAYYTTSDRAVYFDFTPMQYVGWETYKNEIKKVQESIRDFKIMLNDDLDVRVVGLEGRLTEVLEKQRGKWKIVHEHASVPAPSGP
ncbi:MAG: nuclear transport factor 2 family protein [Acidobacteriia bacterium]|nr:nuclear transport factor 2 family protein [Terriglobia bacterium]